jgi:hypothetical protein
MQAETDKLVLLKSTIERLRKERADAGEQLKADTIALHEVERQLSVLETQEATIGRSIADKENSVAEYKKMISESENAFKEMMDSTDNILQVLEKESREIQARNARIIH